jgi:hypothetical protein
MNARQAAALQMEPNPLQKALDNYQELERQWHATREDNQRLKADNAAFVAEIGMLREELRVSNADRVRHQAVAATLLGRLLAIQDTINGAVRAAIKDGLEAKPPAPDAAEQAHAGVAKALEAPAAAPAVAEPAEAPPATVASPGPSDGIHPLIPRVDFGGGQGPAMRTVYRR